jgi:hypothetical protein
VLSILDTACPRPQAGSIMRHPKDIGDRSLLARSWSRSSGWTPSCTCLSERHSLRLDRRLRLPVDPGPVQDGPVSRSYDGTTSVRSIRSASTARISARSTDRAARDRLGATEEPGGPAGG